MVVERKGRRIVLRREEPSPRDYASVLRVRDAACADRWSWEWREPGLELFPVEEERVEDESG